ncbi:MAG: major capsid protein [Pseudomonadota bacterium]|nr:major capsid protein [Pseudomonadota bacterium]
MNNPFDNPAFSMSALSTAINILPNNYGLLDQMNLLPIKPVRFRQIAIEEKNGVLSLLPTLPVGSPGSVGVRGKRTLRSFVIPHIPHEDVVLPEEVQGIRAFGMESELQSISNVMVEHLQTMRNKHAITLEHLRMGAMKGVILDSDGSVLYNLYNEFKINPTVVDFKFSNEKLDVKKFCLEIKRHMELMLQGEFMTGVKCLVSSAFFDALTSHATVAKAYENWQTGLALRSDMRNEFTYAGITFQEYVGEASDGTVTRRFIEQGEGHAFPLGTVDTFATYFAPADFNETVNTLGQPLYAKQEPRKFDRGTDLHTQSNPLPMCHRPAMLVKVTMS